MALIRLALTRQELTCDVSIERELRGELPSQERGATGLTTPRDYGTLGQ